MQEADGPGLRAPLPSSSPGPADRRSGPASSFDPPAPLGQPIRQPRPASSSLGRGRESCQGIKSPALQQLPAQPISLRLEASYGLLRSLDLQLPWARLLTAQDLRHPPGQSLDGPDLRISSILRASLSTARISRISGISGPLSRRLGSPDPEISSILRATLSTARISRSRDLQHPPGHSLDSPDPQDLRHLWATLSTARISRSRDLQHPPGHSLDGPDLQDLQHPPGLPSLDGPDPEISSILRACRLSMAQISRSPDPEISSILQATLSTARIPRSLASSGLLSRRPGSLDPEISSIL
ncbi:hypothetical protein CTA1_3148 [Colletotrichum tanaceti]|uniref:Uncharacterized protein n=1 Tax=Colletotrichum tanaceti TaxID=1306861 RepID=A0A4U6XVQ2_9PEZI|nr:hypothetical protein CTA1_3148 [Colletotrichum tanaceti]